MLSCPTGSQPSHKSLTSHLNYRFVHFFDCRVVPGLDKPTGWAYKKTMFTDHPIWTMKDARLLLPHRSNSVVQDWIGKGIVSASTKEGGQGTGNRWLFTLYQLWDLVVVDQLAALRVFDKPYKGRNNAGKEPGDGNVREFFYYPDASDRDPRLYPSERKRDHAIAFYRTFGRDVLISVAVTRRPPLYDDELQPIPLTKRERSRAKVGMLLYNIVYYPEQVQHNRGRVPDIGPQLTGLDDHRVLTHEVKDWRGGANPFKGLTEAYISVDLIAQYVELTVTGATEK